MAKDNPGVGERIVDGPEVWAQLLGGNAPALKYSDGEFINKFDEEQARDENGRWTSTGGGENYQSPNDFLDNISTFSEKIQATPKPLPNTTTEQRTSPGDLRLGVYANALGHDGLPTLVDDASQLTGILLYRGIADSDVMSGPDAVEQFKTGDLREGFGYYGNGSYFSTERYNASLFTVNEYFVKESEEAMRVLGESGVDSRMIVGSIPEDAKIATMPGNGAPELGPYVEEAKTVIGEYLGRDNPNVTPAEIERAYKQLDLPSANQSGQASNLFSFLGYDAIKVQPYGAALSYIVLNRSIMEVVK